MILVLTDTGGLQPWLMLVVTAVGVGAAIVAGIFAGRIYGIERRRDEKRLLEEKEKQASQVSGWAREFLNPSTGGGTGRQSQYMVEACIRNNSEQPIYNVKATFFRDDVAIASVPYMDLVPPHEDRTQPLDGKAFWEVFGSGPNNGRYSLDNAKTVASRLRIDFVFTDSNNQTWYRAYGGSLEPRN